MQSVLKLNLFKNKSFYSTRDNSLKQLILVLGGPGTGKTTLCEKLINKYPNWIHYSTGELLRKEIQQNSEESKEISKILSVGGVVPSSITINLLDKLFKIQQNNFIIDGFPRNYENLQAYQTNLVLYNL
eukprot:TRINITY_DN3734_c1_g2_i1.p1 TRINITY_DN3734_c1_g2~~TRINITY_DN3734_c1_g2_i1.p1  ORF type:complete len:129 (+),score=33.36 TRINITY_DN3734_c1_g2_i1:30-416(+)